MGGFRLRLESGDGSTITDGSLAAAEFPRPWSRDSYGIDEALTDGARVVFGTVDACAAKLSDAIESEGDDTLRCCLAIDWLSATDGTAVRAPPESVGDVGAESLDEAERARLARLGKLGTAPQEAEAEEQEALKRLYGLLGIVDVGDMMTELEPSVDAARRRKAQAKEERVEGKSKSSL